MDEFANRIEGNDTVHFKSRISASYLNKGGDIKSKKFEEYLDKLVELGWIKPENKREIKYFATNGKIELEIIAKQIINN